MKVKCHTLKWVCKSDNRLMFLRTIGYALNVSRILLKVRKVPVPCPVSFQKDKFLLICEKEIEYKKKHTHTLRLKGV